MLIFLVGPSRAGKSALIRTLAARRSVKIADLDAFENDKRSNQKIGGWEGRWQRGLELLNALETNDRPDVLTLVDVGAGSLQTKEGLEYFCRRAMRSILVWAPFEVLRERHVGRNPDELRQTEFSAGHQILYGVLREAGNIVPAFGRDVSDSANELERLLDKIALEVASTLGL